MAKNKDPKREIKVRPSEKSVTKTKKPVKQPKLTRRLTAEGWKRKLYQKRVN